MKRSISIISLALIGLGLVLAPYLGTAGASHDPVTSVAGCDVSVDHNPYVDCKHPLDEYPGFGRTQASSLRNDTIAYWEAFGREKSVKQCMQTAGFQYWEDALYPAEAIIEISQALGIQPSNTVLDPEHQNIDYKASLSPSDLDLYYQTLLGETLGSLNNAGENAEVPIGADPETFAAAGCKGQAKQAIPGIWSLRRELKEALEVVAANAATAASVDFRACAAAADVEASTPDDLELAIATGDPGNGWVAPGATNWKVAIERVLGACEPIWTGSFREADAVLSDQFVSDHSTQLDAQASQYGTVLTTIAADGAFLAYLAQAARVAQEAINAAQPD